MKQTPFGPEINQDLQLCPDDVIVIATNVAGCAQLHGAIAGDYIQNDGRINPIELVSALAAAKQGIKLNGRPVYLIVKISEDI